MIIRSRNELTIAIYRTIDIGICLEDVIIRRIRCSKQGGATSKIQQELETGKAMVAP